MTVLTRRKYLAGLAATGASISIPSVALSASSTARSGLDAVNPELRLAASEMLKQFGSMPSLSAATLPGMRNMMSGMVKRPADNPVARKQVVPGERGHPDVAVWIINAERGKSRPIIVHTHGGGFVMGNAAASIGALQPIASALDSIIITVDYRLAPETRFSGSVKDNYAALKWAYDHAVHLGGDRHRIAVMGESSGGGHAALLAIAARDRGEVPLVLQVLLYPILDDRTGSAVLPSAPIGRFAWTASNNRFGWQSFLGQAPGTARVPAAAVPARTANMNGLPPAFIGVGSIDLFVDEDISYARRLVDAGILTELIVVPGAFHGFDIVAPQATIVRQFNEAKLRALRQAFAAR